MPVTNRELATLVGPVPAWYQSFREATADAIQRHPLVCAVMAGHPRALRAYAEGYWPYIATFWHEIAYRMPSNHADIECALGGHGTAHLVEAHMLAMRKIEGSHAELWASLAKSKGILLPEEPGPPTPALTALMSTAKALDHGGFYAGLAATETIAWALAKAARYSRVYAASDSDMRWFSVHLLAHQPTLEQVYRWMAERIYKLSLEQMPRMRFLADARGTVEQFVTVADELWLALTSENIPA